VQHQELKKVKKKDSFGGGRVGGLTHSKKRWHAIVMEWQPKIVSEEIWPRVINWKSPTVQLNININEDDMLPFLLRLLLFFGPEAYNKSDSELPLSVHIRQLLLLALKIRTEHGGTVASKKKRQTVVFTESYQMRRIISWVSRDLRLLFFTPVRRMLPFLLFVWTLDMNLRPF
jgi:hypothetical protein